MCKLYILCKENLNLFIYLLIILWIIANLIYFHQKHSNRYWNSSGNYLGGSVESLYFSNQDESSSDFKTGIHGGVIFF